MTDMIYSECYEEFTGNQYDRIGSFWTQYRA